jgi:hypothetical protein
MSARSGSSSSLSSPLRRGGCPIARDGHQLDLLHPALKRHDRVATDHDRAWVDRRDQTARQRAGVAEQDGVVAGRSCAEIDQRLQVAQAGDRRHGLLAKRVPVRVVSRSLTKRGPGEHCSGRRRDSALVLRGRPLRGLSTRAEQAQPEPAQRGGAPIFAH